MQFCGVIEGFYGTPWTWDERRQLLEWSQPLGLADYVYAPKDDAKHRADWRAPYDDDDLDGLASVAAVDGGRVWYALSPGLSIDYGSAPDREAVLHKLRSVATAGVHGFVLAVDDIPPIAGLGTAHGELAVWLVDRLAAPLLLVPTDYTSTSPTTYLTELRQACPPEVPIGWTGPTVVCDEISAAHVEGRTGALGGRVPWLWDNYPVNDALMRDRLFLGPLRGRDPAIRDLLVGYLANGGVQPRCSRPALASVAGWLADGEANEAWNRHVDSHGCRAFAEACDGEVPRRLVERIINAHGDDGGEALAAGAAWFGEAAMATAPGLEDEAQAWLEQCRAEATIAVEALQLLAADAVATADGERLTAEVLAPWVRARRSNVAVFGPRRSIRPIFGQDDIGGFVARHGVVDDDQNAVDHLMRHLLDGLLR